MRLCVCLYIYIYIYIYIYNHTEYCRRERKYHDREQYRYRPHFLGSL